MNDVKNILVNGRNQEFCTTDLLSDMITTQWSLSWEYVMIFLCVMLKHYLLDLVVSEEMKTWTEGIMGA